jgi:hypothetical protein
MKGYGIGKGAEGANIGNVALARCRAMEVQMNTECVGCGKPPDEIDEFMGWAQVDGTTPKKAMINYESTYNPDNGLFCCNWCYIAMGKTGQAPEMATPEWRELMPKNGGKYEHE